MRCTHLKCGRDDLPPAPAFPIKAKMGCAHVRPDGEPCSESPQGAYDDEARGVIAAEPALWDPEVRPEPFGFEAVPEEPAPPVATAREVGKKPRRQDDTTKSAIDARMRALRGESPPEETRVIAPAKPGPAPVKKKAPAKPAKTDDQDVDDWEV